jgi:hypothetical protein
MPVNIYTAMTSVYHILRNEHVWFRRAHRLIYLYFYKNTELKRIVLWVFNPYGIVIASKER